MNLSLQYLPFRKAFKEKTNAYVKELLPKAFEYIQAGKNTQKKLERACYLAAAANVAPMGVPSGAFFLEARGIMEDTEPFPVLSGNINEAIQMAHNVLYVTDNAGEIGFDSLLVPTGKL